jgi:hypothetical protein
MAKYLLVYTGGQEPQSEAEGKAVMDAWTAWFGKLGSALVDGGNPIGSMAKSISSDGKVSDGPIGTQATGYSILDANSLDEAVEMAKGCPHLASKGQITVYETYAVM